MSYIKINKDTLDYHQFADFHAFTMNNFIRSIMRNGKYKKASKIARLGLILGLKKLHHAFHHDYIFDVFKTYTWAVPTRLNPKTKELLNAEVVNEIKNLHEKEKQLNLQNKILTKQSVFKDNSVLYYSKLINKLNVNDSLVTSKFSFFNYFNNLIKKSNFENYYEPIENENILTNKQIELENNFKLQLQYKILSEDVKFKKIYTKRPAKWFYRTRNLTVFDMIIQAYTMLTGIWHMRKIKVSGRTVLVPSPLRPYRRISTVTQMLLKGIRKLRRESKEYKAAMIKSIAAEFYFLVMYYGCQFKHPNITASHVWQLKLQSHKELVANLKNLKSLSHY